MTSFNSKSNTIECQFNVNRMSRIHLKVFFKQNFAAVYMVLFCVTVMAGKRVNVNAMDNYLRLSG